jgi:L-fuconolactonase
MEQMAASSDLIGAIVPYVDLENPALEQELDHWQRNPKFRGVRSRFEGHPDLDVLSRSSTRNGLRIIAHRGLVFEFLVRSCHLTGILQIYEHIPELKGVIEHMAKPDMTAGTDRKAWRVYMKALAENTGVTCKLSLSPRVEEIGKLLSSLEQGWPVESIKPYAQFLIEYFGPHRLMWGSDWPVALLVSDYRRTYQAMREAIGTVNPNDELSLFRTTAMRFYGLKPGEST